MGRRSRSKKYGGEKKMKEGTEEEEEHEEEGRKAVFCPNKCLQGTKTTTHNNNLSIFVMLQSHDHPG